MEVANKTIADKRRVMIIDDNEIDIFINQKVLEFNNFASDVINMQAGQNAIDQLKSSVLDDIPDLIFLDLNMPIMDGFRFLYEFSLMPDEVRAKVKIVVLTSSDNSNDKEKVAANADVLTYISKPLNDQKLEEIASLLS
jgi:CheY-like chemotaxis protein